MLSVAFLKVLHDRLEAGGCIEFATDFEDYFNQIREIIDLQRLLWSRVRVSINQPLLSGAEKTNYELKYITEGRPIYYLEIQK